LKNSEQEPKLDEFPKISRAPLCVKHLPTSPNISQHPLCTVLHFTALLSPESSSSQARLGPSRLGLQKWAAEAVASAKD